MKLNEQAPEKRVTGDGTVIAVNSIFYTIQGEGPFAGENAVFVRLAGCNLQCPLCDTEYTEREDMYCADIVGAVIDKILAGTDAAGPGREPMFYQAFCDLVVITGGEPFRQPIGKLVKMLADEGFRVQVETNGSLCQYPFPFLDERVTIVCSPKTGSVHKELQHWIKAYKYVATAASLKDSPDGLPMYALDHPNSPRLFRPGPDFAGEIYLQPVDEQNHYPNKLNRDAVVASCLKFGYRLCLQLHKEIGVP